MELSEEQFRLNEELEEILEKITYADLARAQRYSQWLGGFCKKYPIDTIVAQVRDEKELHDRIMNVYGVLCREKWNRDNGIIQKAVVDVHPFHLGRAYEHARELRAFIDQYALYPDRLGMIMNNEGAELIVAIMEGVGGELVRRNRLAQAEMRG